jgi:acetyl-CoA/propionyl-CoA carboxylase carboxyl transferase subunit
MTILADAPTAAEADPRAPLTRLGQLLDAGTVSVLRPPLDSGVAVVRGQMDGARVIAYCTDATRMGGALVPRVR